MNYFQAENISKSFSETLLFEGISFTISEGDKVALIARNGAGKSTLLNIIAGRIAPDTGNCSYKNGLRIGYLEQNPDIPAGIRLIDYLIHSGTPQSEAVRAYEQCLQDMKLDASIPESRLQEIIERMDALEAWDMEQQIRQVLGLLKIDNINALTETLSGGQKKRLALANMLIGNADVLLLDEPTNHLDIEMIEWLEDFLGRKKATLLMVTHDRYFLDNVCNLILELDQGSLYTYRGTYAHYLEKKQERLEVAATEHDKNLQWLRQETEWIRRSPQARTTKSKARISAYHERKEQSGGYSRQEPMEIAAEMARMGKKILELDNVSKSFDGLRVLDNFSYVFKRGEKLGVVGANGTGKSTLLNLIAGDLIPDSGRITTGETIVLGYYKQDGLIIDETSRVIDIVSGIADLIKLPGNKTRTASQLLHHFRFSRSMQYARADKLSGGEKRRLYLITVLMRNPNFIILDEPTNDLDIETLNLLEEFLVDFPGCLMVVSHDRFFLDRIADQMLVFQENGNVKIITGNYSAYRQQQREKRLNEPRQTEEKPISRNRARTPGKKSYKQQQELQQLEQEISAIEKALPEVLEELSTGNLSPEKLNELANKYKQLEEDLAKKTDRWIELSETE